MMVGVAVKNGVSVGGSAVEVCVGVRGLVEKTTGGRVEVAPRKIVESVCGASGATKTTITVTKNIPMINTPMSTSER